MQNSYNKYTFFWSGPFSQWHPSVFIVDGVRYGCAEQYMMHKKALLFGDLAIAEKILATSEPKEQKALGRQVHGFDERTWNAIARDVVLRGSLAKFTQNRELREALLATAGTLLVEASPVDKIWGIGLSAEKAKTTSAADWPGSNWLGLTLTEVRDALIRFSSLMPERA